LNDYNNQGGKKDIITKEFAYGEKDEQYSPIFFRYNMTNGDVIDISNHDHININGKRKTGNGEYSVELLQKIYKWLKDQYENSK